jgi:hypothetical protein
VPTQVFDQIVIGPGEHFTISTSGNEVININRLVIDGKETLANFCVDYGSLEIDRSGTGDVVVNVLDQFRISDCAYIETFTRPLDAVLLNVPGRKPSIKIGPGSDLEKLRTERIRRFFPRTGAPARSTTLVTKAPVV